MYVTDTILTAFEGLVGWKQSTNSIYSQLSTTLKESDSGYYVNDLPGITVDLLNYVSDESNSSDYLTSVHNAEALKLINSFVSRQKTNLNTKELLSHNTMIQQVNELDSQISRSGRFVGYAITPRESNTITSKILQVGFLSSGIQTFTLYLYDTSQKTAIETKEISITKADAVEWTTLNWDISFDRETGSAGQKYLIGYYEDDLSSDLYDDNWTGRQATIIQRIFGHYMGVSPVRFRSTALDGINRPVLEYLEGAVNCKTSGFNLRFNTKCDITKVITDNITMFAEAYTYKIAIRLLDDALSYTTLNNISNATQNRERWAELRTEYNGRLNGGITSEGIPVKGLIDQLSLDFSNMDIVCLKDKKGKVQFMRW